MKLKWWLFRCTFWYWLLSDLIPWYACSLKAKETYHRYGSSLSPYATMKKDNPNRYL